MNLTDLHLLKVTHSPEETKLGIYSTCTVINFIFCRYLEEAVMNLDLHDTVVQEHIKGVLYGLIQKLKLYIQAHPNDKMTKSLRMLLMASESLLK